MQEVISIDIVGGCIAVRCIELERVPEPLSHPFGTESRIEIGIGIIH
jgi:hypothetical protein